MTSQEKREKRMKRESMLKFSSRLREWNKKNMEYYGGDYYIKVFQTNNSKIWLLYFNPSKSTTLPINKCYSAQLGIVAMTMKGPYC